MQGLPSGWFSLSCSTCPSRVDFLLGGAEIEEEVWGEDVGEEAGDEDEEEDDDEEDEDEELLMLAVPASPPSDGLSGASLS